MTQHVPPNLHVVPCTPTCPVGTGVLRGRHGVCRYGYARMYSGVSLDTFQKKMTVQILTLEGLRNVGPAVAHMAAVEGLDAHRRAVTMRLGLPN